MSYWDLVFIALRLLVSLLLGGFACALVALFLGGFAYALVQLALYLGVFG